MTLETIVLRYGLLALFLGAGIEGETVVLLGGLLAHRGLIDPVEAALAASGGSFVADQVFFFAGRHFRQSPWLRRIVARPAFANAMDRLERHPTIFILSFRFLYGLRTISPAAAGTSRIRTLHFMALNLVAAAIWGPLFTALGYIFGQGVEAVFGRLRSVEHVVLAGLALASAAYAGLRLYRWYVARHDGDEGLHRR
ncbi:DedA family protein [Novosphingobium sp. AP12]|uniref:DedA family protein n=1 Tax=Novosphingobium sp. AP12 TaxID=1144305 RepID=UPI000271D89C|nr:DedA family protein [Novosphingobium sp. AP12]EJL31855.1 putative membrane-associated protein [Novosphingobium sp. AP12]